METVKLNLYRFGELTGKAKERAAEKLCEFTDQDFDPIHFGEMLAEEAKDRYGIETYAPPQYRLNYCQGDGVAFYGRIDLETLAQKNEEVAALVKELTEADVELWVKSVSTCNHYSHWNTMRAEVDYTSYRERSDALEELAEQKTERLRELLQAALKAASLHCAEVGYKWLEADKEPQYLEERYPEARFTADGKFFGFVEE